MSFTSGPHKIEPVRGFGASYACRNCGASIEEIEDGLAPTCGARPHAGVFDYAAIAHRRAQLNGLTPSGRAFDEHGNEKPDYVVQAGKYRDAILASLRLTRAEYEARALSQIDEALAEMRRHREANSGITDLMRGAHVDVVGTTNAAFGKMGRPFDPLRDRDAYTESLLASICKAKGRDPSEFARVTIPMVEVLWSEVGDYTSWDVGGPDVTTYSTTMSRSTPNVRR